MKRHFWAFMAIVCLLAVQNTQGQQMVPAQKISATPAAGAQMTLAQADGIAFRELSFPEALKERRWKTNFFCRLLHDLVRSLQEVIQSGF